MPPLLHKKTAEGNTRFPSTVDDNKYVVITTNFTLGVRIACDGRKILAYGIVYNLQQSVTEFLYRVQLGGVFSYIVIDSPKFLLSALRNVTLSILMAGFTMLQIGKILNVNRTTIWRRQNSIRKKYMATLQ